MDQQDKIRIAADWIKEADGLLIGAGAGMGVDSGLPDFRSENGFWRTYPGLKSRGLDFYAIADGGGFLKHPALSWGFYGHRLDLYRRTIPHEGFQILRRWGEAMEHSAFVYTSNVDGQFQKAGFAEAQINECHGSLHVMQCAKTCTSDLWPADDFKPEVDEEQCLLTSPLPLCPRCGSVARPNVLMFSDWAWVDDRTERQRIQREAWKAKVKNLVVVELGAGRAVPTVRHLSERSGPRVIRINLRESAINPRHGIGIEGKALEILQAIDEYLEGSNQ